MNKTKPTDFAHGYQCAVEDLAVAWFTTGIDGVLEWLANNMAPDNKSLVAALRKEMK